MIPYYFRPPGLRQARRFTLSLLLLIAAAHGAKAADVVTLASPGPGRLQLTPEALIATHLKVTGSIDARDFATLKAATMAATQVLDLSEATICEYRGTGGSYTPITPDWIVGNGKPRLYPAGELPVHAFTRVGDNLFSKWHYGAAINKIILPAGLRSVSPEAFWKMGYLAEIEVPEASATARSVGGAVYDRGLTRLLAVAPRHTGCLMLPATVTSVADSALHGATLGGIEIKGAAKVSFGEQGEVSCPYVIAPNPADYAETFPGIDVTDKIDEVVVSNAAEGQLARTVGDMGLRAADVRSLTVSGTIGAADVEWLGQSVQLVYDQGTEEKMKKAQETALELMSAQEKWDKAIRTYASEQLPIQYAGSEEEMLQLPPEELEQRLEPESIQVWPEGSFEFWFHDADYQWEHALRVHGTLTGGLDRVNLEG